MMRMTLHLCGLPPQNRKHSLIMRKTDKSQLRYILQNTQPVLKTIKVIKNKMSKKLSQPTAVEGDMTTKCNPGILDEILEQKKHIKQN